jgi:hypothetical protein
VHGERESGAPERLCAPGVRLPGDGRRKGGGGRGPEAQTTQPTAALFANVPRKWPFSRGETEPVGAIVAVCPARDRDRITTPAAGVGVGHYTRTTPGGTLRDLDVFGQAPDGLQRDIIPKRALDRSLHAFNEVRVCLALCAPPGDVRAVDLN